jgi:predicted regulator of amino acid metabolism with ACT domain
MREHRLLPLKSLSILHHERASITKGPPSHKGLDQAMAVPPLELFHAAPSYYSMVARLALAEAGLSYRSHLIDIHLAKQQLSDAYRQLNPHLTVPTLRGDGLLLTDSQEILQWVADQAGVLAKVTGILADADISIDAVLQREADEIDGASASQTDLIILTHDCQEARMDAALARMQALPTVLQNIVRIRKEELA